MNVQVGCDWSVPKTTSVECLYFLCVLKHIRIKKANLRHANECPKICINMAIGETKLIILVSIRPVQVSSFKGSAKIKGSRFETRRAKDQRKPEFLQSVSRE